MCSPTPTRRPAAARSGWIRRSRVSPSTCGRLRYGRGRWPATWCERRTAGSATAGCGWTPAGRRCWTEVPANWWTAWWCSGWASICRAGAAPSTAGRPSRRCAMSCRTRCKRRCDGRPPSRGGCRSSCTPLRTLMRCAGCSRNWDWWPSSPTARCCPGAAGSTSVPWSTGCRSPPRSRCGSRSSCPTGAG